MASLTSLRNDACLDVMMNHIIAYSSYGVWLNDAFWIFENFNYLCGILGIEIEHMHSVWFFFLFCS